MRPREGLVVKLPVVVVVTKGGFINQNRMMANRHDQNIEAAAEKTKSHDRIVVNPFPTGLAAVAIRVV